MAEDTTASAPLTEGSGPLPGAPAGTAETVTSTPETTTPVTFTADQQAVIDRIIASRLDRAKAQAKTDAERAAAERAAQENGQYQTLAEQRQARIAELEAEIAQRDRDALAATIAAKHKLSPALAARLRGTTEAELDADAKELARLLVPPAAPVTEAGKGSKPTTPSAPGGPPVKSSTQPPQYPFQSPGDVAW